MTEERRQPEIPRPADSTERASNFALWVLSHYGQSLYDFLRRRLPDHSHDVDDVWQEVYLRLLRVKDIQNVRHPLAFLKRVAHYVVADFLETKRSGGNNEVSFDDLAPDLQDPPSNALSEDTCIDLRQQLERAVDRLPPMQRRVVILIKRDGCSYSEVAQKLNISKPMVHKYMKQAMVRLREEPWDR